MKLVGFWTQTTLGGRTGGALRSILEEHIDFTFVNQDGIETFIEFFRGAGISLFEALIKQLPEHH